MHRYRVSCLSCKGAREVEVSPSPVGQRIDWLEKIAPDPPTIVSGRERLDGQFGWQCACGNNDLLTTQEAGTFSNAAAPNPQEIDQIVKDLKPDKPKFKMETV